MVSLRKRRLLGFLVGTCNSDSQSHDPSNAIETKQEQAINISEGDYGSFCLSGSSSSKEGLIQQQPVPEVKKRKRHRRKVVENREPCNMRGVYFKNMKWQAAIKVEKKQIHLGTVGSQEEAARLYDRAAFKCGREPNFELSEEEKQELRSFEWDEFLAMTRDAINNKKNQRRISAIKKKKSKTKRPNEEDWGSNPDVKASSDDIDGEETSLS
ncbi:Ethylene-responsive transcription factor-like protein [Zostera marina]|uniref:Ethylene-responsive transcription factor-like protein n=1 Tax=Zostera marina TaxID=29655 RepID=A0A0K9PEY9_ZOSMR|nr:Ethylene-responsive transcription factor-like protein [Zostera marina]